MLPPPPPPPHTHTHTTYMTPQVHIIDIASQILHTTPNTYLPLYLMDSLNMDKVIYYCMQLHNECSKILTTQFNTQSSIMFSDFIATLDPTSVLICIQDSVRQCMIISFQPSSWSQHHAWALMCEYPNGYYVTICSNTDKHSQRTNYTLPQCSCC